MPTPEQLGLAGKASHPTPPPPVGGGLGGGEIDWTSARRRLDKLGATYFHLEKLSQQGCRFTCVVPSRQANMVHRVDAEAATEAEAVRLVLDKAEDWANMQK